MMTRGMSPSNSLARNSPRKPLPQDLHSNENAFDPGIGSSATSAPSRAPLCPIPVAGQNPVSEACKNPVYTPRGKVGPSTPRTKEKSSQRSENFEASMLSTPEKHVVPSTALSGVSGRNRFGWQQRQLSANGTERDIIPSSLSGRNGQDNSSTDDGTDVITPPKPLMTSMGTEITHNNLGTGGGQLPNPRTVSTPLSSRSTRSSANDSETGGGISCNQNGTPNRSVSRTLKYNHQVPNNSSSSATGTVSNRPGPLGTRLQGFPLQLARPFQSHASDSNLTEVPHFELEEDSSFWNDHNVQVLIRARPLNTSEISSHGLSRCIRQESSHTITWIGPPESRFTFDHVACETISQEKLFRIAGLPMVDNCMTGYNSCMFAYGQTGSGKTHTMLGDIGDLEQRPSDNRGMTPRIFEYLFARIQMEEENRKSEHLKFICKCSFLEIYNEQITDLLEPSSTNLQMREDVKKGVYVENLREVEVTSVHDVVFLLLQGAANRRVAATNMNQESSRSHSVFTCVIESKWETDSMTNIRFGRLNLVDLAGSERQKMSGAEGDRLKEAANINKSLSTLGLVIMILVDVAHGKQRHVPYRDSKLTFLLQDSLGGNSKTTIIANVSPSIYCASETLSTLKFAQRAKFIQNNAVVNEDASGDVLALRQQIQQLKEELNRLRRQSISRIPFSHVIGSPENSVPDASGHTLAIDSRRSFVQKIKTLEAILAGSLRREQATDNTAKRFMAEIEQLNHLVRQREDDVQCSKMMLRFREDKIRRLEAAVDSALSPEIYMKEENLALREELQLIRARLDRSPELTRFAMENIRLMEQIRRLQDFYEGGEREVLMEEVSSLRDQLMEFLEGKLTAEQDSVMQAPEGENYEAESKSCRTKFDTSLMDNAKVSREFDDLRLQITHLKSTCADQLKELEMWRRNENLGLAMAKADQLEKHLADSIHENELLRQEIQKQKESLEVAKGLAERLQVTEASLAAAQETAASAQAAVKQIRLETEDIAIQQRQSFSEIHEAATMWRLQELQLRAQLEEAQKVIETLSLQKGHDTDQATGLEDRIEHETEFQNTEAVMNLRLELEAMKHLFEEECAHRKERDEINLCLRQQLEEAEEKELEISKKLLETAESLDLEKSVVEALENQQLLSINQIKHLQEQKKELMEGLKTREKEVQVLTGYVLNLQSELQKELEMRLFEMGDKEGNHDSNLKVKLEKMKRALEHAEELNSKLQHDHDSLKALELEKDLVRADAEMETTQAITLLQSEILSICEDQAMTKQCELKAEVNLMEVTEDFRDLQVKYKDLLEENSQLAKLYENKLKEKDAEISMLTQDWKIAVTKLSECLIEGNQALDDVTQEFESLTEEYSPSKRSENGLSLVLSDERGNTIRVLQERLVHAQKVAKGIENKVRVLSEATIAFTEVQRKEKIDMQKDLQDMALTVEKLNLNLHLSEESLEKTLYESEQLQSEIQDKESLVQGLHVQLENSESQKNKLQQEFDLLKQNRETIINSYEHKLQMAEDDIHKLKLRAETAESAYANLLAHLNSQTYQLAEEKVLMLVEIQVLQGLLNFHEEVLQEELLNCQSILEAKEGEFLKQLTELEMEKHACEMGTEELRKVACEAWQRVSEEEKSIKALQSEHYNLQLNLSAAESEYSAVSMDLTKSKREWECERERLENALKESDSVIAAKEQEVSSLHVHLEALAAIADSLYAEEEENVEKVSTLSQKILVGLHVESLYSKETIVELEKDHNQNLVELKSREDDIDRILTQLLEYAQKEIRMELEIEMLRGKTTEQDEKKTEFESLTTQLNVSREKVQQLETSNINLLEALTKEKALTFQLSLELQEKHEHLDEMRCKHSQSQAQCQRLDEELHKFGNTVEQLEQDNVCLLGKMEEEKNCVLHLQRALAAAHEKANKATSLNKQLEESIAKKDNMLQQQIEQLHECYAKLKHLETEGEILHEEVNKQQCLVAEIQFELETTRALYSEDIKQMTECLAGERIRMLVELELIKHLFECKGYLLQEELSSSQSSFQVFEQNYCDEIHMLKIETAILRDRITELDAFIQNLTQELQQSQESAQMFQLQAKQVEQRCTCLSIELEQKSEQWAEAKLLGMVETEIIEQVFQRHIQILHEVLLVSQSSLEAAKQLLDAETGHSENESKLSRNQNTEQHAVIGELTGRLEKYIVYVQKLELQAIDAEQRCNCKAAKIEELEREKLLAHDVMEALKAENKQTRESFVQIKNMHAACLENLQQKETDFERILTQSEQQKTCHEEDLLKNEFTIGVLQSEFKEVIARAEEIDKKYRDVLEQLQARDLEVRKLSEEHHQLFEKITLEKEEKLKLKMELEVQMDLVQKESQQKWMILHSNNEAQYLQKEKELVAQLDEVHAKVDNLMIERLDLKVDVDRKRQDMDILRQELQKSCDIVAEVKGAHLKTLEALQSKEFEIEMLSTRVNDMGMKESQLCLEIACLQEQRQSLDKGNPGDINIYQTGCHKVLNLIDVVQAHEIRIFSLHDKIERCLILVSNHVETKTCARFISACNKVLSDMQSLVEGCSDFKEHTKSEFDEVKMQVKSMSMLITQLQNEKKHMQEEKDKREAAIKNWHHHFQERTHATSEKAVEVVHGHEMKLISLQTKIEMITEWLSHDVGHDTKVAFIEGCELVLSEVEKEVQTSREHAELAWKKVEEVLAEKKMVEYELVKKVEEALAEKKIVEHELVKKEHELKGLQLDLNLLQESASEARDRRVEADEAIAMIKKLQEELSEKHSRIQTLEDEVCRLQESSLVVNRKVQAVDATASEIRKQALSLEAENVHLKSQIEELLVRNNSVEEELEDKQHTVEALEMELLEVSCLMEQKMGDTLDDMNCDLNLVTEERDRLRTELLVLTEQLEMAQQLAEEHEAVAVEARQIAETSKTQAEQKEEEAKLLERSVQELESTINALETQVGLVKNDADRQRLMREDIEVELQALRHQMSVMQARQSESEAQQNLWGDNQRDLEAKEMYLLEAEKRYQVLKKECAEKDKQIKNCKAHISELSFAAERQASEHHQKLRALESMVEHLKVEQKSSACVPTTSKIGDKCVKSRGSGSPFKCIGSGLTHQINSEMDEELISNREKIEELEALASSRQKEIFMLNTRLAEAESMTHDVIRDLLGVKLDITNYASLMNGQHVQTVTEKARVRSEESQEKDGEFERLKKQLAEFIEERESWLEEINRRQAEMVTARVAAEKLRQRDQLLSTENEALKAENAGQRKRLVELEEEVNKLSGQQNLQQRIHHHAKIKEENNTLRAKNDDLVARLRRTEVLFSRVSDELARYRAADGKTPQIDFEEEQRLKIKLEEVEEERMQVAQKLLTLCTSILKAAGVVRPAREVDPTVAAEALAQLQDRLESTERELSDMKLKNKIEGEKRRLSELRAIHSPMTATNFAAAQSCASPNSYSSR